VPATTAAAIIVATAGVLRPAAAST
jgi:hypothetical protein